MAPLANSFSWSHSAAEDFDACRRKRYWSKYGAWGGWDKQATPTQRKAYQLGKMNNIFSLQGLGAERAVLWALRQLQSGKIVTADDAYEQAARPYLNQAWSESKRRDWQANPKQYCCLREHYYGEWDKAAETEKTAALTAAVKKCLGHFVERVWPRLREVRPEHEVPIAIPGGGDPESFTLDNIKIYAIPDYVYRRDAQIHIHDWKAGQVKPEHENQLALYGLWAHEKQHVAPDDIFIYIEYLQPGQVAVGQMNAARLEQMRDHVRASVLDMAEYLVDGDTRRNAPRPREEWELACDRTLCQHCNFLELCRPELEAGD